MPMHPLHAARPLRIAVLLAALLYGLIEWLALLRSRTLDRVADRRSTRAG